MPNTFRIGFPDYRASVILKETLPGPLIPPVDLPGRRGGRPFPTLSPFDLESGFIAAVSLTLFFSLLSFLFQRQRGLWLHTFPRHQYLVEIFFLLWLNIHC